MPVLNSRKLGDIFERHALQFLQNQSLLHIASQYRCPYGEIDLIMRQLDDGCINTNKEKSNQLKNEQKLATLIMVEVRARNSSKYAQKDAAVLSVNAAKQKKIILTATYFLSEYPQYQHDYMRFDVIVFQNGRMHWHPHAFLDEAYK